MKCLIVNFKALASQLPHQEMADPHKACVNFPRAGVIRAHKVSAIITFWLIIITTMTMIQNLQVNLSWSWESTWSIPAKTASNYLCIREIGQYLEYVQKSPPINKKHLTEHPWKFSTPREHPGKFPEHCENGFSIFKFTLWAIITPALILRRPH